MTVLSAQSIRLNKPLTPFCERTVHKSGMTYGLGPNTYDIRIRQDIWLIPFFRSHVLASTLEEMHFANVYCGTVQDKSTLARQWVFVQNTHIDAGFRGGLTLEITYEGWFPKFIEAGTPIAQIEFRWLDTPTEQPYSGKYTDQCLGPQKALFDT